MEESEKTTDQNTQTYIDPCENKNDSVSSDKQTYIIDDIISEYGYSLEVWKIIITSYFILFIDGYNSTYFSSMIIPYKELFELEDNQLSFLGSLFYISKGVGFLTVAFITKYINRIYITKSVLFFLIVLSFSREYSTDFHFLIFNRAITGILVGIIEILATNILCEVLPRRFRAFTMIISWGGYAIGQFTPNLIMSYTMPNLEAENLTKTHMVISIICFLLFIVIFIFFEDSPRNLILNGYEKEAMEILRKMHFAIKERNLNITHQNNLFTEETEKIIINQVKESNKTTTARFLEIFSKEFALFTFCALIIFFNSNFYGDGFTLISTLILRETLQKEEITDRKLLLKEATLMQIFNLFGNILCGFLVEIRILGRRRTLLILMTSIITICLMSIIFMEHISLFMSIFNLLNLVGDIMIVYTSEVYPTRIRDLGTGFINSIALSGSVLSQYAFIYFFKIHFLTPFYVIIVLLIISITAVLLIPVESHERTLDVGIIYSIKPKLKSEGGKNSLAEEKEEEKVLLS